VSEDEEFQPLEPWPGIPAEVSEVTRVAPYSASCLGAR
jgi:hypothetical protein